MNRKPHTNNESWEDDAVWKLLDQAPAATAAPSFADDVVRAAKLSGKAEPWWKRIFSPVPLAGFAAATAALAFVFLNPSRQDDRYLSLVNSEQATEIQEIVETETLIAAVDHLDDFSETELASLIGF